MAYDFKNKSANVKVYTRYMLAKTAAMFEWEGLPPTIPYNELEKILQVHGYAFITKVDGELYALSGGLGGEMDAYGNPTQITIANPALKLSKVFNIKEDGVLIRSDDSLMGLIPIFDKYHTLMVENEINMVMWGYNSRLNTLLAASDDRSREGAEKFIQKMIAGDIGIIAESQVFDGVKVHSGASNTLTPVTQMTELHQYLKAAMYNEVGLRANWNMKRERLITAEVEQSDDGVYPFVDNMMKCRLEAIVAINEMFEQQWDVDYGSVWFNKRRTRVDSVVGNDPADLTQVADLAGDLQQISEAVVATQEAGTDSTTVVEEVTEMIAQTQSEVASDEKAVAEEGEVEGAAANTVEDVEPVVIEDEVKEPAPESKESKEDEEEKK